MKDKKLTLEANRKYIALREMQDVADFTIEPENVALQRGESLFSKAPYAIWLHRLEAIWRCFASGEAGYFPYHVLNGHIDGIGEKP